MSRGASDLLRVLQSNFWLWDIFKSLLLWSTLMRRSVKRALRVLLQRKWFWLVKHLQLQISILMAHWTIFISVKKKIETQLKLKYISIFKRRRFIIHERIRKSLLILKRCCVERLVKLVFFFRSPQGLLVFKNRMLLHWLSVCLSADISQLSY